MMSPDRSHWKVPAIWKDRTVVIIGGGPSVAQLDLDAVLGKPARDFRVLGCNDAYMLGDWVDLCYFGDYDWYHSTHRDDGRVHREVLLKEFKGEIVTCSKKLVLDDQVKQLRRIGNSLQNQGARIGWFRNTGASAVNLALRMGAAKVVLVGFDMTCKEDPKASEDERRKRVRLGTQNAKPMNRVQRYQYNKAKGLVANWHPNYKNYPKPDRLQNIFLPMFERISVQVKTVFPEAEILNATEGSAIKCFPFVSLEEVL